MDVLFVGGTGLISSGSARRALEQGLSLTVLNRGLRLGRLPEQARLLQADYRDEQDTRRVLGQKTFDVVVDFITFLPEQMAQAIRLFSGRTSQYIFISSASVYEKPLRHYLVTEQTPLGNPYWAYARDKIRCEQVLQQAIADGFPGVIVRPSLTYADFNLLTALNSRKAPYSLMARMLAGEAVVVHGDGLSLWVITHTDDFAKGLVGLFGNQDALGETFHITTDEVLTWDAIYTTIGQALGVQAQLIHIPSDYIGAYDPQLRASLLGDHANSVVFDNSKIKRFVPGFSCSLTFAQGCKRAVDWFNHHPDHKTVDDDWNAHMDSLIAAYRGQTGSL